jgi:acetoin utilization deacetylase AcuC-like enzyme
MRFVRRLLRRVRPARLWVVYHADYAHTLSGVPLDPHRAARVLAFLREERVIRPESVTGPRPATLEAILRVHSAAYVATLDRLDVVSRVMGVPMTDLERETLLDYQRLAAGGTMRAARLALRTGRPALNLAGGLHHATPDQGMGFCLVNDVAIAVAHLRHYGFRGPVLVVDLDLHDGNGTRAVFAADPTVHTFSIHNADWEPRGGVASTAIALGSGVEDEAFLRVLRETLPPVIRDHRPELVFYVAGTDPAEDDRLGDWRLTARGMLARDQFVVEEVRRARGDVPLVAVLSGGYGREAWRYTARFASWLAGGAALEPPDDLALLIEQARRTRLTPEPADDWGLTEADLGGLVSGTPASRVLGSFSGHAVELSLEQTGVLAAVRERGFRNPTVTVSAGSGLGETIRVFGDAERRELVMELRMSRSKRAVPDMEVLYIEWLKLQNPRAGFQPAARRLPGQEYPGLGLLREVVAWMVRVCDTLGLDGLAARPAQYYMAAVSRRHMHFIEPEDRARFEALYHTLGGLPLPGAEEALAAGRVVDAATGSAVSWEPSLQVYPVSRRMTELLQRERARAVEPPRFVLVPPLPPTADR